MRTPHTFEPGLNAWIISRDFIADDTETTYGHNQNAISVRSHHCPVEGHFIENLDGLDPDDAGTVVATGAKKAGLTQLFRLYDDDQNLYYEGYMRPLDQITSDNADGFEPLEDFGTPNAGATELRYWVPGEGWKTL